MYAFLIVVQLFNAVSKHGKELQSKVKAAGPSERKKAKGKYVVSALYKFPLSGS